MKLAEWVMILGFLELDDDVLELYRGSPLFLWVSGKICYCFDSANFMQCIALPKVVVVVNISGMQGRQKHICHNHIFHCPISFPQRGYSKLCKFTFFLMLENMS